MKRLTVVLIVLCSMLSLLLASFSIAADKAVKGEVQVLKIGAIVSLTGPIAAGMQDIKDAMGPTEEYFNSKGGIMVKCQRYHIKIIAQDDQSSPQGALAAANKLISKDGVKFMIAPPSPQANMAIAPICEKAKVIRIRIQGVGGTNEINSKLRYSFASYQNLYNAPFIYDYLLKNYPHVKKVATVTVDDPGGHVGSEFSEKAAKAHGLELVAREFYPFDTQDFYPIMTKVLDKKPDALDINIGMLQWGVSLTNQARELGFKGPIFGMSPFGDINSMNDLLHPSAATDIILPTADFTSPKMPPAAKAIAALVQKKLGHRCQLDNTTPIETLIPLLQAIEKAQSFDPDKVVDTWEKMTEIDTIFGKGRMGGMDYFGINHVVIRPVPLSRIMNGKVETVGFFEKKD
jgi:branched-chain amino acid transport system substrate-binding protein